jgi:RNA-directed DNA polymerase
MTNSLTTALSVANMEIVWRFEKARLRKSCFGIDRQTGKEFEARLNYEFFKIRQQVAGSFKPKGLLAIAKPKPHGGNRIICVPTVSDRVLQFCLLNEFRPKLEARGLLNSVSYGLIRSAGRGVGEARKRAVALRNLHGWVYKADIEKFFDKIPREAVRNAVTSIISQRSLHKIILPFVDAEIEDGFDQNWQDIVAKAGISKGVGVRQGMPLSPYFAGMLLRDLDRAIEKRGTPAIRYIDDIVAFFDTEDECLEFHDFLESLLGELGLSVGSINTVGAKTATYHPSKAAEFLGMEICPTRNAKYDLRISQKCIEKVGSKFAEIGNIDTLLQRRVTLPRFGNYVDAMESGYIQAYQGAENHAELVTEIRSMKAAALTQVLEQALGEQVSKLGRRERRFLGII